MAAEQSANNEQFVSGADDSRRKVALVTGASSGFGRLTAEHLLVEGYRVFGTTRKELPGAGSTSTEAKKHGVEMITLDVRSEKSVREGVGHVLQSAGRVDLLVNNAGVLITVGPDEETSPDEARTLFETNFFGVTRMTHAVLPSMRSRRSGRIINISSLAGLLPVPGQALYSASKFAVEGYSEALRQELMPYGITVSLVEPGFFSTNIQHFSAVSTHSGTSSGTSSEVSPKKDETKRELADYDGLRPALRSFTEESFKRAGDPRKVARLIAEIARTESPRLRYRVGDDTRWSPLLKRLLPDPMYEIGARKTFGLPDSVGEFVPDNVASDDVTTGEDAR